MVEQAHLVSYLPFERKLQETDEQIHRLEEWSVAHAVDVAEEVESLRRKRDNLLRETYADLTAWNCVLIARHPQRPQARDYIERICDEFLELHGDRGFADDKAMVAGLATIAGRKCVLVGQHKGRDVHERAKCNFGYSHPEGYRKALHKMRLAEKFHVPLLCLIDTPGAAAAVGAEERGISEAIAHNLMDMSGLKVPVVCLVIGEGGSGGALGIGVGDVFLMQEFAYFSVITPEGCASILWRDANKKEAAAEALKLTGRALMELGVVDGLVPEPLGGAHRDPDKAAEFVKEAIAEQFDRLCGLSSETLLKRRYRKLRGMGKFNVGTGG